MATGDDLELGATNSATNVTHLAAQVNSAQGLLVTNSGTSGSQPAVGLEGHAGSGSTAGVGVHGVASGERSIGVLGECSLGTGVKGKAGAGSGVVGDSTTGLGVSGTSSTNAGVKGFSTTGPGVLGRTDGRGVGVHGRSRRGSGVLGTSTNDIGVSGTGSTGVSGTGSSTGVSGTGNWGVSGDGLNVGVLGTSTGANSVGVVGAGPAIGVWGASASGLAGRFDGDVLIDGDLVVTGEKSAAVPLPDGTLRRLFAIESPESWFEDFGTQKLVKGKAEVTIDPRFAAVVRGTFHIFLTPYGDSNGLYVARRSRRGFFVREQGGGTSSLVFGYRIVAPRKDTLGTRFEKFSRRQARLTLPRRPPSKGRRVMAETGRNNG